MEELREFLEILKEENKNKWELLKIYKEEFGEENIETQKQISRCCECENILDALEEFIAGKKEG